jgi:hypothetical protein
VPHGRAPLRFAELGRQETLDIDILGIEILDIEIQCRASPEK